MTSPSLAMVLFWNCYAAGCERTSFSGLHTGASACEVISVDLVKDPFRCETWSNVESQSCSGRFELAEGFDIMRGDTSTVSRKHLSETISTVSLNYASLNICAGYSQGTGWFHFASIRVFVGEWGGRGGSSCTRRKTSCEFILSVQWIFKGGEIVCRISDGKQTNAQPNNIQTRNGCERHVMSSVTTFTWCCSCAFSLLFNEKQWICCRKNKKLNCDPFFKQPLFCIST